MESLRLHEFTDAGKVHHLQGTYGNHDYEDHWVYLKSYKGEYYLLYLFDSFPGGYGEIRCDAVMHISEAESMLDSKSLFELFFHTERRYLIRRSTFQKELTLTCLCAVSHEGETCYTWCASAGRDDIYGGCIIYTDEEAETLTEEELLSALKDVIPEGTVIPECRRNEYNKEDILRSRLDEVYKV